MRQTINTTNKEIASKMFTLWKKYGGSPPPRSQVKKHQIEIRANQFDSLVSFLSPRTSHERELPRFKDSPIKRSWLVRAIRENEERNRKSRCPLVLNTTRKIKKFNE